jgi:hypothetical protein
MNILLCTEVEVMGSSTTRRDDDDDGEVAWHFWQAQWDIETRSRSD